MEEAASLEAYLYHRHLRPFREEPPRPPAGRPTRVETDDGVSLGVTVFEATSASKRVVVIAPATGVLRGYYAPFAAWLAARGYVVVTFDYRGMGASRGSTQAPTMHDWGEHDLASVLAWASETYGGGRAAVVGHSAGGQLVGLVPDKARIVALVTVGAQSGDYRLWPMPQRLAMAALWYGVVPTVTRAVGYLPGSLGVGEDLPAGVALEWARWCRTPGYLVGREGVARRGAFADVRAPLLAYGFDDDGYAPPAAVDALLALYVNATIERRQIGRQEGAVGHFGFFRERHAALWREAASFLDRHFGA
ncbi:MAG: alpha/beta fold hydrolase [Labilithrix sp.]|nr:alpha/beta fold hydrolase [Labilithrix sp.]